MHRIIGTSAEIAQAKERLALFARNDMPVLITGETGTGKELAARAIHQHSPRAAGPFVPVNCGGFPANLIESELFGHAQGAFTGAVKTKNGLVAAAENGTLFLDEIGELPLSSQCVLLRFLDSGEFRRIGETTDRTANVRIVSATNRDLEGMAGENAFRMDLYFRLKGAVVPLLPLRQRRSDIRELALHYLNGVCEISGSALDRLCAMDWPGNVRELHATLCSLATLCNEGGITGKDVATVCGLHGDPKELPPIAPFQLEKCAVIERFEREYLCRLMEYSSNNLSHAAQTAGLTRKHLRSLLRKLQLYNHS